jgi:hypothetical protein
MLAKREKGLDTSLPPERKLPKIWVSGLFCIKELKRALGVQGRLIGTDDVAMVRKA